MDNQELIKLIRDKLAAERGGHNAALYNDGLDFALNVLNRIGALTYELSELENAAMEIQEDIKNLRKQL